MIRRDPAAAAATSFDLIVVGGGIYGVTLALESARRGLRPLLLEKGDFGGATSWNSLRIVHGGLRYLQKLDLPRFFESVAERSWFLRHFPELVQPLPCLMPLYGKGLHRVSILRAALALNDLLSYRRNAGLRADRALADGGIISAEQTARRFPAVEREGLRGGALWHDAVMPDSNRLVLELLHWATRSGAAALNYVEARELVVEAGAAAGVNAIDHAGGGPLTFRAPVVLNCAGPWCREVSRRLDRDVAQLFRPSLAFNLFLDHAPIAETAVAVTPPSPGARTYFLYPWKDGIFAGTFHAPWTAGPDDGPPGESEIRQLLEDLRAAVPALAVTPADVIRVHWGLLPAAAPGVERLAVREVIWNHGERGGPRGLFSLSGVKFTTARRVALKVLRVVFGDARPGPAPGGDPGPGPVRELPGPQAIERLLVERPQEARALVEELIREEAVVQPDDLLLRRTDWGLRPNVGRALAESLWSPATSGGMPDR